MESSSPAPSRAVASSTYAGVAEVFDEVECAAELEAAEDGVGEDFEDLHLFGRERARSAIDDAETCRGPCLHCGAACRNKSECWDRRLRVDYGKSEDLFPHSAR